MKKIILTRHSYWLVKKAVMFYSQSAGYFNPEEKKHAEEVLKALDKIELKSVEGIEITKEKSLG